MATTITTAPGVMHVTSPAVHQIQPAEHPATKYKNIFMGLGVTLVTSGVLSFILGGVGLSPSVTGNNVYVASGLWGGAWFIASGALAIATGVKANSCNVIGGMVVSILTSLVAFGVGITESVLAGICGPSNFFFLSCSAHYTGIHATIAFLAFLSCILAIVHSSFCCCGGCGQNNYQGRVLATTTVTTVPGGQFPLQHTYGNVVMGQPTGQVYYPSMGQGQPQLMQGQPQLMQGQPQLIQGQQFAAYPPAQNPYPATAAAGYGTQPQNPYPANATAGYGTQPQTQSAFVPPPYTPENQGQKQNFQ